MRSQQNTHTTSDQLEIKEISLLERTKAQPPLSLTPPSSRRIIYRDPPDLAPSFPYARCLALIPAFSRAIFPHFPKSTSRFLFYAKNRVGAISAPPLSSLLLLLHITSLIQLLPSFFFPSTNKKKYQKYPLIFVIVRKAMVTEQEYVPTQINKYQN